MVKRLFLFLLLLNSCLSAADNIVLLWNQATLDAIMVTKAPPTIASRALALVHTAIYDAWSAYDAKALSTVLACELRRPKDERTRANRHAAISFAAYRLLVDLFPARSAIFNAIMRDLGYDPADTSTNPSSGIGVGNTVALALIRKSHKDGSNQLGLKGHGKPYSDYTDYTPKNKPDKILKPSLWQPLMSECKEQLFATPQWGCLKPFCCHVKSFRPKPPATYPSERFTKQAEEVLKLSAELNDKSKMIAEYWADGPGTVTPPGHWNLIAQKVSHRDRHSVADDVKLFFILNNALFDTSIAVWDTKRHYNSVRPITAIHYLFHNKMVTAWRGPCEGTGWILGNKWQSYLPTPPFPEYVSGHSSFSAAAAEVLKEFTCSDCFIHSHTFKKGVSAIEPCHTPCKKITLRWRSFSQAAAQAAFSRRLGGIHFKAGDLAGRHLGKCIAQCVYRKAQRLFKGR